MKSQLLHIFWFASVGILMFSCTTKYAEPNPMSMVEDSDYTDAGNDSMAGSRRALSTPDRALLQDTQASPLPLAMIKDADLFAPSEPDQSQATLEETQPLSISDEPGLSAEYRGKGKTLQEALQDATRAALRDKGPDAQVKYVVKGATGLSGGIAGVNEMHVTINEIKTGGEVKGRLCGDAEEYKAFQQGDNVMVFASGWHRSAGYKVFLIQKQIEIFPPQFTMTHAEPSGPAAQVITPFALTASFIAKDPVKEVIIEDAKGSHKIKVKRVLIKDETVPH